MKGIKNVLIKALHQTRGNCIAETPFIGMFSLAFRNPKAIKNIYRFKWSFFAIENVDDVFYLVCLPMNCIEAYINGDIDEVPAIEINENDISLIDKAVELFHLENL